MSGPVGQHHRGSSGRAHHLSLATLILAGATAFSTAAAPIAQSSTETSGSEETSQAGAAAEAQTGRAVVGDAPSPGPVASAGDDDLWSRRTLTGDWWGARSRMEDAGIDFEASLVYDVVSNLAGGIRTGTTDPYLFNAQVALDLETMFGLEGAEVFVLGQAGGGGNPSDEFVGDYQGVDDNAIDDDILQLSQLWYRQRLFEDRMSVQIGKLDFLESFASPSVSASFINNGLDYPSTLNISTPTYPNQAFGVLLEGRPVDGVELLLGVYDGSNLPAIGATDAGTGGVGPKTFFDNIAGYFVIGEAKCSWRSGGRPGTVAVGGWGHTGDFTSFRGGRVSGTGGGYAYAQQAVWLADESDAGGPGISIFGIASFGEAATNPVQWSLAGGMSWRAPIPSRSQDEFGIGVAYARFTDDSSLFASPSETAIEAFYVAQLTPWLSLQPDLQYVIDPGGNAVATRNAFVGILRVTIDF